MHGWTHRHRRTQPHGTDRLSHTKPIAKTRPGISARRRRCLWPTSRPSTRTATRSSGRWRATRRPPPLTPWPLGAWVGDGLGVVYPTYHCFSTIKSTPSSFSLEYTHPTPNSPPPSTQTNTKQNKKIQSNQAVEPRGGRGPDQGQGRAPDGRIPGRPRLHHQVRACVRDHRPMHAMP